MRVVVAGSSGLIGTALVAHLREAGHDILRLVRRAPAAPDERGWDPPAGHVEPGTFDLVHPSPWPPGRDVGCVVRESASVRKNVGLHAHDMVAHGQLLHG